MNNLIRQKHEDLLFKMNQLETNAYNQYFNSWPNFIKGRKWLKRLDYFKAVRNRLERERLVMLAAK